MKLLADCNDKYAVFSVSHYDYRAIEGLMADGGQPGCQNYAGYTRFSHQPTWIELPNVTFADLTEDYNKNRESRKYGIHPIEDVILLEEKDAPDTDSLEWRAENACWGTFGKSGTEPYKVILLKNAETDHLKAILATQRINQNTLNIINYILSTRK